MVAYQHPRVVVGVDGSLTGLEALRVAVGEARRRRVPLYAVRAATSGLPCVDRTAIATAFLLALGGIPQDVEVHQEVAADRIRDALRASASDPRDLIVVGTSGKGAWHAVWAGSAVRSLLRGARCPIMAVPAPEMARRFRLRRRRFGREDLWARFERETPQLEGHARPGG